LPENFGKSKKPEVLAFLLLSGAAMSIKEHGPRFYIVNKVPEYQLQHCQTLSSIVTN
jgi:hypothetical protein